MWHSFLLISYNNKSRHHGKWRQKNMLQYSYFNTCQKKTKVFCLLHLLTMVKSTWVEKWIRIGRHHPLQSSGKVPVYLLVRPPRTGHQWTIPISRGTFRIILASESHWLQPVLVLSVQPLTISHLNLTVCFYHKNNLVAFSQSCSKVRN